MSPMPNLQFIHCERCGGMEAVPSGPSFLTLEFDSTELTVAVRGSWCSRCLDAALDAGPSATAAGR